MTSINITGTKSNFDHNNLRMKIYESPLGNQSEMFRHELELQFYCLKMMQSQYETILIGMNNSLYVFNYCK